MRLSFAILLSLCLICCQRPTQPANPVRPERSEAESKGASYAEGALRQAQGERSGPFSSAAGTRPRGPLSQELLQTTDGGIAVGNLESAISAREQMLRGGPDRAHLG